MSMVCGINGRVASGENGCFAVGWRDRAAKRPRIAVGYVGEDGIKPLTWYRADSTGKLIEDGAVDPAIFKEEAPGK